MFANQTEFLARHGVSVPRILANDPKNCRLWIEDLGDVDLWSYREADWDSVKRPLYEATLREVAKIHALKEETLADPPIMDLPFDESLYEWELNYFLNYFVANFSEVSAVTAEEISQSPELRQLKTELAAQPRCLVHRDFQSQNVLIREGKPTFIDYQGLRFGLAEYDVASLIFDPYVPMERAQRDQLIEFAAARSSTPDFMGQLMRCAAQRLMQALGAYGFLGLVKGKSEFLQHIAPGVQNLKEVAIDRQALPCLAPLLNLKNT